MSKCPRCPVNPALSCLGEAHRIGDLWPLCRDVEAGLDGRARQLSNIAEGRHPDETRADEPAIPPLGPPPDGKVRVGLVCPCLNPGGAEAWQLALARLVDPARIRWEGCAVLNEKDIDPGMRRQTEAFMPVAVGTEAARDLARKCDVLVMWAVGGSASLTRGMERPPKVVEVCHAPAESPWGRDVYGKASGIDRWVAVSELAMGAIPPAIRASVPCTVIRNCVDAARLRVRRTPSEMRAAWGVPERARVAGYLGRLSEEKDPHAMRRLIGELPSDWHAVLVGAGCEEIDPHPRLHLVGPDPAAGDCLNAFDVLVVPSKYESFGLTIAEGLWMGRPTVTTPVGVALDGPGRVLTRLVPVGSDGETLALAVLAAWANGPRPGSREWVAENLSDHRFGREWTDLILSMAPRAYEPPGLLSMAGSFARAAAAHVVDGVRIAGVEIQAARKATCDACPQLDAARNSCRLCGCGLTLKRRWASSECPEGRWRAV